LGSLRAYNGLTGVSQGGSTIDTRRNVRAALALAGVLLLCGCTLRSAGSVAGSGSLTATPTGPGAVLKVVVPYNTQVSARGAEWGTVRTQNPDVRFADLAAYAAREDAGLDVIAPFKVADTLEQAGLYAGLHPDAAQIPKAARAVGCAFFLTADVRRWQYSYFLFTTSSLIDMDLTCRSAANGRELWSVHVFRRARGLSDGEVARLALADAFRWLRDNDEAAHAALEQEPAP
jgi:hypothetical protein